MIDVITYRKARAKPQTINRELLCGRLSLIVCSLPVVHRHNAWIAQVPENLVRCFSRLEHTHHAEVVLPPFEPDLDFHPKILATVGVD